MKAFFAALCALVLCLALAAPLRAQSIPAGAVVDDIKEITIQDDTTGIRYPEYAGPGSDALRATVNAALAAPVQQMRDFAEDPELDPASVYLSYEITRKTVNHLSISYAGSFMHPGAAHPVNPMFGVTVDLSTGQPLSLPDLVQPGCDIEAALLREAKNWIADAGEDLALLEPLDRIDFNATDPWRRPGFYITNNALALFFQEYVYTPHAYGPLVMTFPLKNLAECLKQEFLPLR